MLVFLEYESRDKSSPEYLLGIQKPARMCVHIYTLSEVLGNVPLFWLSVLV